MTNEELMIQTLKNIHWLFTELEQSNADSIQDYEDYPPMRDYFEGKRDAFKLASERMESAIKTAEAIV